MKFQYYLQEPDFRVGNIDVQSVSRPKGYRHSFPSGREKHGFLYVVEGGMVDFFQGEEVSEISLFRGELVFLPKGSVYTGTYTEDGTQVKIIQFDLIHGELPPYLSKPVKIGIPRAHEWIEPFFQRVEERDFCHPFYYLSCLYGLLWQIDENCVSIPMSAIDKVSKDKDDSFSILDRILIGKKGLGDLTVEFSDKKGEADLLFFGPIDNCADFVSALNSRIKKGK